MCPLRSAVSGEFDDEAISVGPVMHDRVFHGTLVHSVRAAACDQERRSRRDFEPARHRRIGQSSLDTLSGAEDFLPADPGQPCIQRPGVELVRRGLPASCKDPRGEPRLGHADRFVVCKQKSADVKSERAFIDLKRFGGFLSPGRFLR